MGTGGPWGVGVGEWGGRLKGLGLRSFNEDKVSPVAPCKYYARVCSGDALIR